MQPEALEDINEATDSKEKCQQTNVATKNKQYCKKPGARGQRRKNCIIQSCKLTASCNK